MTNPAATDRAIVAGISRYPGLGDLGGPENDAREFLQWLVHDVGVPKKQTKLIVSSNFKPAQSTVDEQPASEKIEKEFDRLHSEAHERSNRGEGLRIGRRLYVFLSGHGYTPQFEEAALLTANATRNSLHHVPGRPYVNYFLRAGIFDEVVLFMDCCRELYPLSRLQVLPFVDLIDPDAVMRSKLLYGFATKWSRLSREKQLNGRVRGVFTTALLQALRTAAEPGTLDVTARSLSDYLYNNMKKLLTPQEREDPSIPKEPDMDYDNNPSSRFVLLTLAAPVRAAANNVHVHLSATDAGLEVAILDHQFRPVAKTLAQPPSWSLSLSGGVYLAQILARGRQESFEVGGQSDIIVRLD